MDRIAADPVRFDVSVPPGRRIFRPTHRALAYVFTESGKFCDASDPIGGSNRGCRLGRNRASFRGRESVGVFDRGDEVNVLTGDDGIRCLLVSVLPLEDPVAWYGPMVMNTQGQFCAKPLMSSAAPALSDRSVLPAASLLAIHGGG